MKRITNIVFVALFMRGDNIIKKITKLAGIAKQLKRCNVMYYIITSDTYGIDIAAAFEKDWIDITVALFPVFISGVALLFTWAQFSLAKKKRNDDLFDKRHPIYMDLLCWARKANSEKGFKGELCDELVRLKLESRFLFSADVVNLFEKIEGKYRGICIYKDDGISLFPDKTINEMPKYKALIEYFCQLPLDINKTFEVDMGK